MSQGVYVLGGKCPGGKCPGGKCPGGICPWGKCPGGTCPGGLCPRTKLADSDVFFIFCIIKRRISLGANLERMLKKIQSGSKTTRLNSTQPKRLSGKIGEQISQNEDASVFCSRESSVRGSRPQLLSFSWKMILMMMIVGFKCPLSIFPRNTSEAA